MKHSAVRIWRAAAIGCALSLLATASQAIGSDTASGTDAACLSGPKGAAPQGERWFYRIDRNTKKQCWYTRAATTRDVAARKTPPPPARETSDVAEAAPAAPMQPAFANARAEAPEAVFTPPPPAVTPPPIAADTANRMLAERFADHPDANRPVQPRPAVKTQAATAPATPANADQGDMVWILLCVIGAVIGLIGLAFGAIRHFSHPRVAMQPHDRWEQTQWDDEPTSDPPLARNDDAPPLKWLQTARDCADRGSDELHHLLSRPRRTG